MIKFPGSVWRLLLLASLGSSVFSISAEELTNVFLKGPYLQGPGSDTMTIKWEAPNDTPSLVRYGLEGKLIDFGKQKEVPVRELILELLEFVDDVVDELGSRKEIEHVHTILQRGTSADLQLEIYKETNDLSAVVDKLIELTVENVPQVGQVSTPKPTTTASTISK